MKKVLFTIMLILTFTSGIRAQQFWQPSEIDALWRVWDSADTFNWLIESGQKVEVSFNPLIRYTNDYGGTSSMTSVTEVSVCFIRNNKVLALTFSKSQGIRMYSENNVYKLSDTYSAIGSLEQQYWFNIDFERIVYSPILDWLLIPCGYHEYIGHNAIAISFSPESSIAEIQSNIGNSNSEYYNLQGIAVDPENAKGQILIKTDGRTSEKILNR